MPDRQEMVTLLHYLIKKPRMTAFAILAFWAGSQAYAVNCNNENPAVLATTPLEQFEVHTDGTATHLATGLMWMQCSLGQDWNENDCSGLAGIYNWQEALQAASAVAFAGYTDWRLPSKNELESIVEERCWSPSINAAVFPATPSNWFWSSSPHASDSNGAWVVSFGDGHVVNDAQDRYIRVRLVRDGL